MKFCHISPTKHLSDFCEQQTHHLLLAHLIEDDPEYAQWYASRKSSKNVYIMDNSAFEMYKQEREMYPMENLIEMGTRVGADYIVMSDYPNAPGKKTIEAAELLGPRLKQQGFGTFFVPQSEIGDVEDYIATFAWAASSRVVDYIGVSILGVPNAYGVERDNKLQRFMSRWRMMNELEDRGILNLARRNNKKIHFLGMVDGPNEIALCYPRFHIDTWDSSAGVWAGLRGIAFDTSPTGLVNGKYEEEVDFNYETQEDNDIIRAQRNCEYINNLADFREGPEKAEGTW